MQGNDDQLTVIHGPYGQGGGRLSRSFLALAALHQEPVAIQHIRANRDSPDFRPKPLKGLEALAHITGVEIERARNGMATAHDAFRKRGGRRLERSMEISLV
jgi:RNA 3'-terminal phosphate cyclase